ncbi:MAG TPA: aminotransferase class I/II-fold pyridoxal phosphate-dependent enzyme [Candidatus Paceibacterota bacterium]|nr:aminotransferase class I/II-fold pyridoxal phosphate-dependent enzyme [Candidatus Paceibacterota bacterium]
MANTNAEYMAGLRCRYDELRGEDLKLDMTRGNPSKEQLDLSNPMIGMKEYKSPSGVDCRNYDAGSVCGLIEMRKFAARYLGTPWHQTIVGGPSSLNLMSDYLKWMLAHRWKTVSQPKFIMFKPHYDRHYTMLTELGFKIEWADMNENGPDATAASFCAFDGSVVGMIFVPKYSNPNGVTCSRAVARQIARMPATHEHFTVMLDDAYRHHDFTSTPDRPVDFGPLARRYGTRERFVIFGSFSKVTLAGSALSMMALGPNTFEHYENSLRAELITADKLRQLHHLLFLKNMRGLRAHMRKHRRLVEPKFHAVHDTLEKHLGGKGIATWTKPEGGYFVLVRYEYAWASRVHELCAELGVKLTEPFDETYQRLAPTYPPIPELVRAMERFALCAEIAHREKFPR